MDAARRSWYSMTFGSDVEQESDSNLEDGPVSNDLEPETCHASMQVWDASSEASTDVGLDDVEYIDEVLNEAEIESETDGQRAVPSRPSFPKANKEQRVDHLRRLVDDFQDLDFSAVDASSQQGLVLRMLTILKSLSDSSVFYSEGVRFEEKRTLLLGLGVEDEGAIRNIADRAQDLCEGRKFRDAFDVLKEAVASLRGERPQGPQAMSAEEIEAMRLRRLQKKQRQRQERREERTTERAERSAQRRPNGRSTMRRELP